MIAADPSIFPGLPTRVGLYQCFLSSLTRRNPREFGLVGETAARSLAALAPEARQAFLLTTVEDFSREEAATIMEVSQARIDDLVDAAGAEIGRQIATDVLIIEDEALIALDLKLILESLGHRVTAIARSRQEALNSAARNLPGLVIADIRLADGSSGLDAVNEMLSSFEMPVVFVTAYPEALTTGERPEPAFVVAKPFRADTIKAIVSQVLFFDQHARRGSRLN
jgi:CheY-like chemotaxis protein